jgi:hypothetical protein
LLLAAGVGYGVNRARKNIKGKMVYKNKKSIIQL